MLILLSIPNKGIDKKPDLADSNPIDLTQNGDAPEQKTYDFQMQGDYSISESNPTIKVWNPETNTRIFSYKVFIDEDLLTETKGITPGNMIEVDASTYLSKKGEHDLVLELSVLDENTGAVVGQAQRNAILTIN